MRHPRIEVDNDLITANQPKSKVQIEHEKFSMGRGRVKVSQANAKSRLSIKCFYFQKIGGWEGMG